MIKKKFMKTKCKVTFILPDALAIDATSAFVVGDFNDWDEAATPMERIENKSGVRYEASLDLQLNEEYQFRYFVNNEEWHNDWHADRYVPNPFSGDNSVISTEAPAE